MKEKKKRAKRLPTFAESITPIIAMLLILTIGKGVFGYSTEPLLIMVAASRHLSRSVWVLPGMR